MIALTGFIYGFLFSVIPGPAGFAVVAPSFQGEKQRSLRELVGLLLGDLVVILGCLLLSTYLSELGWFETYGRLGAGLFFIGFSVLGFMKRSGEMKSHGNAFLLTLMNPSAWIGIFALLSLAEKQSLFWFILMLEIGVSAWFLFAIFASRYLPRGREHLVRQTALALIGVIGVILSLKEVMSL